MIYVNIESLCCTTETKIMLYVNYISRRERKERKKKGKERQDKTSQSLKASVDWYNLVIINVSVPAEILPDDIQYLHMDVLEP